VPRRGGPPLYAAVPSSLPGRPRGAYDDRMDAQSSPATTRPRQSRSRRWGDLLLIAGGLVLSYPFWSGAYASYQQARLSEGYAARAAAFTAAARAETHTLAQLHDPTVRLRALADLFARRVRVGDPVGRLRIPRLAVNVLVIQGTRGAQSLASESDSGLLRSAPVHYGNTPFPGQGEPFAVAGHRTTYGAPFYRLGELRRGDAIIVDTPYGRFTYAVVKLTRVLPSDVSVLYDRGYALVLTTCDPPYSASHRLIVWARETGCTLK